MFHVLKNADDEIKVLGTYCEQSNNSQHSYILSFDEAEKLLGKHRYPDSVEHVNDPFNKTGELEDEEIKKIEPGSTIIWSNLDSYQLVEAINILKARMSQSDNEKKDLKDSQINELRRYSYKSHPWNNSLGKAIDKFKELKATRIDKLNSYVFSVAREMGDVLKRCFSYTLGFRWFLKLSCTKLGGCTAKLPSVEMREKGLSAPRSYVQDVSPINFWTVGLDYLFSNLGKLAGYVLSMPYTIPAYIGISGHYGMKKYSQKRQIRSQISEMKPDELAYQWASGYYELSQFVTRQVAKYVNANNFISAVNSKIREIDHGPYSFQEFSKKTNNYIAERRKVLLSKDRRNLLSTIIMAIVFLPSLCWTVTKRNSLLKDLQKERGALDLLEEFKPLKTPQDIYNTDKKQFETSKADWANIRLPEVKPDVNGYKNAMKECANYFIARGDKQSARYYAKGSGDKELIELAQSKRGTGCTSLIVNNGSWRDLSNSTEPDDNKGVRVSNSI